MLKKKKILLDHWNGPLWGPGLEDSVCPELHDG